MAYSIFIGVAALIGLLVLLFKATTLAYRIDRRSHPERYGPGVEGQRLNILAIAINWKVAKDAETQALRKQMNRLLLFALLGCACSGLLISWVAKQTASQPPAISSPTP